METMLLNSRAVPEEKKPACSRGVAKEQEEWNRRGRGGAGVLAVTQKEGATTSELIGLGGEAGLAVGGNSQAMNLPKIR